MTDPNGWPFPDRLGVPLNPERNGWHWLQHPEDLRPMVTGWDAELQGWPSGALYSPQGVVDLGFRYLGPALLPAEVAAREAAAAEAMREAAADCARRLLLPDDCGPDEAHGRFQQAIATCEAIRALPLPDPDARARKEPKA